MWFSGGHMIGQIIRRQILTGNICSKKTFLADKEEKQYLHVIKDIYRA